MTEEDKIGAVVDEMYAMISGPAGPRGWSRQRAIFHPEARQMRTGLDESGKGWIKIMSLDEYRENTTPFFAANPFYEIEIARRIDVFGNPNAAASTQSSSTATKPAPGGSSA
jgi:hypothetical protein